jgi:hypothetical protein
VTATNLSENSGLTEEGRSAAATIAGGSGNRVRGPKSAVGGGENNNESGNHNVIAGGRANTLHGGQSGILSGFENIMTNAGDSAIVGGFQNAILGDANGEGEGGSHAFIGGGEQNTNRGDHATIAGGFRNVANGAFSTVAGGNQNKALGESSFAAGATASAGHDHSFVWGDGTTLTASRATNTFTVRATGGVKFLTTTGVNVGPSLTNGSPDWASNSDSNLKTAVTAVDHRAVLAKLASLPVTEWQLKDARDRRFIGPMAQDFRAAFGLGLDEKTIGTLDADGVLFSAIKGLIEEIKLRDEKIAQLEAWSKEQGAGNREEIQRLKAKSAEVDGLKAKLRSLENRLNSLPPAP